MSTRHVRVSEDFIPVSEFKTQAAELLKRVGANGQPLVITQHGKPAGVVLSPAAYDALIEKIAFMQGVHEGLAEAEAGHGRAHAEFATEARKRYKAR
jgi:prevent-host-death family protein